MSKKEKKEASKEFLAKNKDFRAVGIYGVIDEEKSEEALFSLLSLHETRFKQVARELTEEEREILEKDNEAEIFLDFVDILQPIELVINTTGGSASDMFALYDVMTMIKEDCDINTMGVGNIMSAGVLLMAAGTKGNRRIGKNCRVMIHSVQAGMQGASHEVKNELEEIMLTEERYFAALAHETKMTIETLAKMLEAKVNVYLSAEEAIEYGIADILL